VKPGITIIVPVWDSYAGSELDEALCSLLGQGYDCRIIVVDNASAVEIEPRPGIEVLRSASRVTLGAARNLGVHAADTEFVMAWDADDAMLPGTLRRLLERLLEQPQMVAFGLAMVDANTGQRHRWPRRWTSSLMSYPRLFALLNCVWSVYPTTGATLMRTAAVSSCSGYTDADSGDDWALGVSLLFRGPVGWDERPGRLYANTPGSIWMRHSTMGHLVRHARAVRRRVWTDPEIPTWAKLLVPMVWLGQWLALALHAALKVARAILQSGPAPGDARPVAERDDRAR
jgi:glycosyltransferase involved in cell wall biosynthesis